MHVSNSFYFLFNTNAILWKYFNSYLNYLVISKLWDSFMTKLIQFEQYRKFQLGGFFIHEIASFV